MCLFALVGGEMSGVNWNKIRNEYINGNISYKKLAEKHKVSFSTLKTIAGNQDWVKHREEQRKTIGIKLAQKTAEKIVEKESDRMARINEVADKLIDKIEEATQQLDIFVAKNKQKSCSENGRQVTEELPKAVKTGVVDAKNLKQLASALRDIREIQFNQSDNDVSENITFVEDLEE